jgi:tryptophan synthase alpha chain
VSTKPTTSRVRAAFERANSQGRAAFVPYVTAGFPDAARGEAAAHTLAKHADLIEVGLPYSDPLGDGPTIQRSSETALRAGATTASTLALVKSLRAAHDTPVAVMTYYNPIFAHPGGEAGFVAAAAEAGVEALILPDLPPDEGETLVALARQHGIDTVFLVAPTSTDARLARVTRDCSGFVYAVSVTGVTGARDGVPGEVKSLVERTRDAGGLPVAVGFGVGSPETAQAVARMADGVVVGSALVERVGRMQNAADTAELNGFAASLKAAMQR